MSDYSDQENYAPRGLPEPNMNAKLPKLKPKGMSLQEKRKWFAFVAKQKESSDRLSL